MPEPGYSATSSPSKSSSSSNNSSSSSSSDESKSSSSSETKTESIASSPTTEEKLSGESKTQSRSAPQNHQSDSDSNSDKASSSKSKDAPKSGEGSRAAAEASASKMNSDTSSTSGPISSSIEPVTREAIEPGTSAASNRAADVIKESLSDTDLDAKSTNEAPTEPVPEQALQSLTTVGSVIGDSLQGTVDITRVGIDRTGMGAAGDILTKGNGGNLPAPGFGSRADLASRFNEPLMTAAKALDETPFSAKAASTKVLIETAEVTGKLGVVSRGFGNAAGPLIGFGESFREDLGPNATTGKKIANAFGGALKEVDDGIISGGLGALAGAGQAGIGGLVSTTGIGAPVGGAMIYTAPVTGTAVSVGTALAYDNTAADKGIDSLVDSYVEPAAAAVIDTSIAAAVEAADIGQSGASWAGNKISQAAETVRSWFK